ncbi:hypothetical protein HON71_00300 [Candidatus Woesearchaeota archaeon]|jgi:hypothetical protein|nr:hypothetical protein [Candidatus Woesearchaeota archaeon]
MKLTRENVGEYIKEFKEKNKDIIKKSIKDDKKKHNQIARHVLKQAKEDLKLALKLKDINILEECELKLIKTYLIKKRKPFYGCFAQSFCDHKLWETFYNLVPERKPKYWGARINFYVGPTFEEKLKEVRDFLKFVKNEILKT